VCDAFHVELWGMYLDLNMAWKERVMELIVESDSEILINITDNG
jgi:hypothetical protein